MSLAIQKAETFEADVARQFEWYVEAAGGEIAWRFQASVDVTLLKLARQPDLGRHHRFRHPRLSGLRSFRVERPFNRLLIFYRSSDQSLQAWRLMPGARDLPRRLLELPGSTEN